MNGETYQIVSVNSPAEGKPFNQLIGKDFIVVDYKQDQTIDKVMAGNPEMMSEYQKIYKYGINQALEKGKLKERENIHSYSNSTEMKYYNIITYFSAVEKPYNEFIYAEAFIIKKVIKALDRNADGQLDIITSGVYDLKKLQKEYSNFIKSGVANHRIAYTDGMYLVVPQE